MFFMTQKEKEQLERHKTKVLQNYKKLGDKPPFCPALKQEVNFTKAGWRHLTGKSKKRTIQDIYRRLRLFSYVESIVRTATTFQDINRKGGGLNYTLESVIAMNGGTGREWRKITVVILQDSRGNKNFLSVSDKKLTC